MANINNINTENTWLDVETVAKLKNISKRGIRLSLNQDKYEYKVEKVRGGKTYKIKLSSLEEEYQIKYIKEYYNDLTYVDGEIIELQNLNIKQEKLISQVQKQRALAKYDIVMCWLEFRRSYKKNKIEKANSDKKFVELYNTGILHENIFKTLGRISFGSLYRWRSLIKFSDDWTALVGQYKYSTSKEYNTSLNEEQVKIFLKILLSPNSFSIGKSISLTKHILSERGYEILPKDVTFRRYAEWFRDANYDKWILAREGQKALKDKVEPYIVRNASLLKTGQVLIADGHTLNFQVINPFTGRPCRATLLGFLDWKSGGLVGYDIMLEECTQNIASALRNAILNLDHVPDFVYQDNGRAFKSKFFNGDKKFEELGFTGIYQKLGIKPVYAVPYNARAKVIERFFLDFQEGFEKLMPSYIGTSIENKPAYMKRNEKLHRALHEKNHFIPTIEQAMGLINEWLKYKHAQPCTNAEGKTIQEVLDDVEKQNICEKQLDDLMLAQEVKHIGRNGIRFLKADYFDEALYGVKGQAIIKYSLSNLRYIKVYSIKGEFICRADRVTETHPLAVQMGDINDIEDFKHKIEKQQKLRRKTIKAVKEHFKLDDLELIEKELVNKMLIKDNLNLPKKVATETKLIPKVKTSIVARPIFKSNFERYDWHMKYGCISQDDRTWLASYIKSEEYKEIYEI
ncbi:MAG: transposase family protein [Candidatus Gastranaerophilales bacterium]|nr:transposase family protein [Candidatus Gastranaerophilales bacterium]